MLLTQLRPGFAQKPYHFQREVCTPCAVQASPLQRRLLVSVGLLSLPQVPFLFSGVLPAEAKPKEGMNKEADAATSPFIQALLARSAEKKEERAKALLQDYMRRNYKDYFQYEAGGRGNRGLSEETKKEIQQWMKDNP